MLEMHPFELRRHFDNPFDVSVGIILFLELLCLVLTVAVTVVVRAYFLIMPLVRCVTAFSQSRTRLIVQGYPDR